jgi:GH43 family beta-xylosidase
MKDISEFSATVDADVRSSAFPAAARALRWRSMRRAVLVTVALASCREQPDVQFPPDAGAIGAEAGTLDSGGSDAASADAGGADASDAERDAAEPAARGLLGEYWSGYARPALERVDPTIDFSWGEETPHADLPRDHFSARWTGFVEIPAAGSYTFATSNDDGVRVWIGDILLIDDWRNHFPERHEGTIDLGAGPVPIRIDYYEWDLVAEMRLFWTSAGRAEELVPLEHLVPADAPSGERPPQPYYVNPVVPFDCPDPGVLHAEEAGLFYAVCTGGNLWIRRSENLVLWQDTGASILPGGKPSWAANGARNWAPELHRVGDRYVAYYTTVNAADVLSIGAAWAPSPEGPYTESSGPLVEHPDGVIDPHYFLDTDGRRYLTYKIDGNAHGRRTPILLRELDADGLSFLPGSAEVELLGNDPQSWEGHVIEGQWLVKRDGRYYLFYSGNAYDHHYRTGVARADSVTGPYEKLGPPILSNNGAWVGPGHGSVVTVEGVDVFVYHAWRNDGSGIQDGSAGRQILLDRIVWIDGWPRLSDGTPSSAPQPWPGTP